MTDPKAIAAGLTEAQKRIIKAMKPRTLYIPQGENQKSKHGVLHRKGILQHEDNGGFNTTSLLTPLGLAVKKELERRTK